jgi:O-antigen/teichoic acid export membrane protein
MTVAACNVLGNLYLIPIYGIKGAALATLFSQCLGTWGLTLLIKPLRASTISMIKAINPTNIFKLYKEKKVVWI